MAWQRQGQEQGPKGHDPTGIYDRLARSKKKNGQYIFILPLPGVAISEQRPAFYVISFSIKHTPFPSLSPHFASFRPVI